MRRTTLALAALMLMAAAKTALAAGAIAIDDNIDADGATIQASDIGYGAGYGDSQKQAAGDALKNCASAGNGNCRVVVTYDACGAYAISTSSKRGKGTGENEDAAKREALKACGEKGCQIAVSDCAN